VQSMRGLMCLCGVVQRSFDCLFVAVDVRINACSRCKDWRRYYYEFVWYCTYVDQDTFVLVSSKWVRTAIASIH
jgi:hypothetical protein